MDDNTSNRESYYNDRNIPIQLCNVCNTKGDLTPYWFRFEDREHKIHKIRILQVVSHKEINYVGMKMIQFICRTCEEGEQNIVNLVELRYNVLTHRWIFFQILS